MATKKQPGAESVPEKPEEYGSLAGEFKCPSCGKTIYHGSKVGVEVACQECGERHTVPEPDDDA